MPTVPLPIFNTEYLLAKNTLVVADLHLGIERTLALLGFNLPNRTNKLLDKICKCNGDELILLGDFKDQVAAVSDGLGRELENAARQFHERFDRVILVQGNHDGGIDKSLDKYMTVAPSKGIVLGDIGFAHGHAHVSEEILECKTLIIGHIHPRITFIDRLQRTNHEPCWYRIPVKKNALGKLQEILVMPASNPLCGGSSVNKKSEPLLGPLLKTEFIHRGKGEVYLLDGTHLGKISDLWI
ncbi:MAG TPA: hypothetical protein ENN76_02810 [Euryarchaeota archaeon]|nr:hypothetical protein [Euryarchaeota archaeon]